MTNKTTPDTNSDYEVGFGKPPAHTKFQKGQSGNPKGRPKGKRNVATVLQAALNEKVTVTENGCRKQITKLEATIKQVVNRAAIGESSAIKLLLQLFPFLNQHLDEQAAPAVDTQADQQILANLVQRLHSQSDSSTEA